MSDRRISVVLAHPDDESFGMGGTLAKYAAQGMVVNVILATRGEEGIPGVSPIAAGETREQEVRSACRVLAVHGVDFLNFHDGRLAAVADEVGVEQVSEKLREQKPDVVVTFGPDGVSGHPDHVTVSRWTTLAFDRLATSPAGPRKLYYLAPSEATQQACGSPLPAEMAGGPVASIDIEAFKSRKVLAMQQHRSQHPPFLGPPEVEAASLACHEVFLRARPVQSGAAVHPENDLFVDLVITVPERRAFGN